MLVTAYIPKAAFALTTTHFARVPGHATGETDATQPGVFLKPGYVFPRGVIANEHVFDQLIDGFRVRGAISWRDLGHVFTPAARTSSSPVLVLRSHSEILDQPGGQLVTRVDSTVVHPGRVLERKGRLARVRVSTPNLRISGWVDQRDHSTDPRSQPAPPSFGDEPEWVNADATYLFKGSRLLASPGGDVVAVANRHRVKVLLGKTNGGYRQASFYSPWEFGMVDAWLSQEDEQRSQQLETVRAQRIRPSIGRSSSNATRAV